MVLPWARSSQSLPELATIQDFDALQEQELTVVFKHSPTCPVSLYAHREVSQFCADQPDVPVYLVSVRRSRDVARHIADRTGVRHESPQILVLRRGQVVAAASHDDISVESLTSMLNPGRHSSSISREN